MCLARSVRQRSFLGLALGPTRVDGLLGGAGFGLRPAHAFAAGVEFGALGLQFLAGLAPLCLGLQELRFAGIQIDIDAAEIGHNRDCELGIVAGSFAFFAMLFLIFLKLFPVIAIAEVKELVIHEKAHGNGEAH